MQPTKNLTLRLLASVRDRYRTLCTAMGVSQRVPLCQLVELLECDNPRLCQVAIRSDKCLVDMQGLSMGQRYWWLRGPAGFVPLPNNAKGDWDAAAQGYRGTSPFSCSMCLPPGFYVLGVGHADGGIRCRFAVSAANCSPPLGVPPTISAPREGGGSRHEK